MLLHVLLYLSLALSGFALVALLLLRRAVAEQGVAPRPALTRASRLAGLVFLLAGGAIALSPGPASASLLAGRELPEAEFPALTPGSAAPGASAGGAPAAPGSAGALPGTSAQ